MNKPTCLSSESGAVLIFTVIVLLVLLAMAALAIDLGVLYVAAQQAQNTADAAALAGAGKLREGMDPDAAKQEAIVAAANNTVLNDSVTLNSNDVKVGAWDAARKQVVDWDPTARGVAVQVTVRRAKNSPNGPVPTFFAKVLGRDHMDVSRTAIAGLFVNVRPRNPVSLMIVQDGSTSFQQAWSKAVDADTELLKLINGVSITGDSAGMVTFNAKLPEWWLRDNGLYNSYRQNPGMNEGIKYTTDKQGRPRKTSDEGDDDSHGQVRPMTGDLTDFDPGSHSDLARDLDKASKLIKKGNAWGDTDTAAGLDYAIDRLLEHGSSSVTQKTIVLVSDGKPHDVSGDYYSWLREQAAIEAADRAEREGIRIHTVTLEGTHGANFDFNEGLIRNGGYALRAADANKLRDLLISVGAIEVGHPSLLK